MRAYSEQKTGAEKPHLVHRSCQSCGAPNPVCAPDGGRGHELCRECAKPDAAPCMVCGRMVEPVWLGPTQERPNPANPLRWMPPIDPVCPRCQEARQAESARVEKALAERLRAERAGIPAEGHGVSFNNSLDWVRRHVPKRDLAAWYEAYQACRYWTGAGKAPYIHGPARRGKSFLAYAWPTRPWNKGARFVFSASVR